MVFDLNNMFSKVAGSPYINLFDRSAIGAPTENYGIVIGSYFFTSENALQIAMDLTSNDLYTRKLSGNVWSEWKKH